MRIAALLTSYNRRDTTLCCINLLYVAANQSGAEIEIFVVDDLSTDGTPEAIHQMFPRVRILSGTGTLFWAGGMRKAFAAALEERFDYYLWLNDDTQLYPSAITTLLNSVESQMENYGCLAVIIGTVIDPDSGRLTYGGRVSHSRWRPLFYHLVDPAEGSLHCETMNGNCVLIPYEIAKQVGNLDDAFIHGKADYDYGYKVRKAGYILAVADQLVGVCAKNSDDSNEKLKTMNLVQRWRYLTSPKLYPPAEWLTFTRRYAGRLWVIHWLRPYIRIIFC